MFWEILWRIVLIAGMVLFAGLAVIVTIGGAFDIKRLFAHIAESHRQEADEASSSDGQ